ncbi:MAG: hypothetical protein DRI61_14735 [Chloroflexi bacterium]|nr:MAG: hypothetical protein DRI61_14735 [Chloroflexota bacterium]
MAVYASLAEIVVNEPKYWGSWKGRVVKAIAIDGARTWNEVRDQTGLSPKSLNRVLAELFNAEAIEKHGEGEYRIAYELYREYKEFDDAGCVSTVSKPVLVTENEQRNLVSWIDSWRESMGLDFSLQPEHFYLDGDNLNNFSIKLIENAKKEVLVVNPFVDQCSLSDTLWKAASSGTQIMLVTRPPADRYDDVKERKEKFLTYLEDKGVKAIRNPRVHAKLIVVDRAVAVVSSMNFQSSSSGGSSWEAGLVTKNDMVVESIVDSILALEERPENI